jgi:GrpB-like predicted nucleotidyltransferase (UPF0157 family)
MLSAHDPKWFAEFAALEAVYSQTLGALILRVEHVGSTAVPDLLAKPILDIDLVMRDYGAFDEILVRLDGLGYEHEGDQGIFQRESFRNVSRADGWMPHHLYLCPESGAELQRHIRFRDALRGHTELRREYEAIKLSIANRSGGDFRQYARIKEQECGAFVERVLLR